MDAEAEHNPRECRDNLSGGEFKVQEKTLLRARSRKCINVRMKIKKSLYFLFWALSFLPKTDNNLNKTTTDNVWSITAVNDFHSTDCRAPACVACRAPECVVREDTRVHIPFSLEHIKPTETFQIRTSENRSLFTCRPTTDKWNCSLPRKRNYLYTYLFNSVEFVFVIVNTSRQHTTNYSLHKVNSEDGSSQEAHMLLVTDIPLKSADLMFEMEVKMNNSTMEIECVEFHCGEFYVQPKVFLIDGAGIEHVNGTFEEDKFVLEVPYPLPMPMTCYAVDSEGFMLKKSLTAQDLKNAAKDQNIKMQRQKNPYCEENISKLIAENSRISEEITELKHENRILFAILFAVCSIAPIIMVIKLCCQHRKLINQRLWKTKKADPIPSEDDSKNSLLQDDPSGPANATKKEGPIQSEDDVQISLLQGVQRQSRQPDSAERRKIHTTPSDVDPPEFCLHPLSEFGNNVHSTPAPSLTCD